MKYIHILILQPDAWFLFLLPEIMIYGPLWIEIKKKMQHIWKKIN